MADNQSKNYFAFLKGEQEIEQDLYELLDEGCRLVLKEVIKCNYSLDDLRGFLEQNLELKENQRKLLFKFWKAYGRKIMQKIELPVSNNTQGIKQIDWEVSLTTHSRHQSNIQNKTATILLMPRDFEGSGNSRIMFEVSKQDVS